jgi:tetratricopeptide (TPR) repeat protein
VYARDRYEERPLIWKAVILKNAGRLDEAETVVRQALKVDPTDGETKAGDRVRSYGVLADILAAKGKTEDATFFRNVVQSVRIAEQGDELTQAGLTLRSLAAYEKAQGLFADAYCIQWRLAERLSAKGNMAEAEKHYRIAFERMPEQFGQVASLCFGCEGVFNSRPSQSAAERVLADLIGKSPVRPQVYYLLGQLREAQERWPEAYDAYKQAATLDPDYLDALEKRYGLGSSMLLPRAEQDNLALSIMAMDPLGRHASVALSTIQDARGLWAVVSTNQQYAYTPLKTLLALPATTRALEEKNKADSSLFSGHESYYRSYTFMDRNGIPTPGNALLQTSMMEKLISMLGIGSRSTYESDSEIE